MNDPDTERRAKVSTGEFSALFNAVSNWNRWGPDDERGALNYLTADCIRAAVRLVRTGQTLTLGLPLRTRPGIDNPVPAEHRMTMLGDRDIGSGTLRFAKDYIGADYHNAPHSHIDALCHVAFGGALYNGAPIESLTAEGASAQSIGVLTDGLVGRGVLLDVPGTRGARWIEPGEDIFPDDLELCERQQGVTVGEGDILLIRTGQARRDSELGPTDAGGPKAGLHPTCVEFFAARHIAALGSDGNSDTAPSSTIGIDFPVHVLTVNAMGLHLLDYLQFEGLLAACQRLSHWDFLFVAAPLRVVGGTGSPVNPIAIL